MNKSYPGSESLPDFTVVDRPVGPCLLHQGGTMWIVHYPMPNNYTCEFWRAYRVLDWELPLPKGRKPWTVNNRFVSNKPFLTLDAAVKAVREISSKE